MGFLDSLIKGGTKSPPKVCVFGAPGVGKTTFGASAKSPILVDMENGAGQVGCVRTPYLSKYTDAREVLQELAEDTHEFKTVVIDSVDWLVRRAIEHVTGAGDGEPDAQKTLNRCHGGYGVGRQMLSNLIYGEMIPLLNRINAKGISIILLAHADMREITDAEGVTIEKVSPDLPKDAGPIFTEWLDALLYAKKQQDGTRVLITEESDNIVAKNRYSLPPVIKFSWQDFVSFLK